MLRFSRAWFAVGFCLSYPLFLALDWHLFLYYPMIGEWSFGPLSGATGPAMEWYGLIVSSGLAGVAAGLVLPERNLTPILLRAAVAVAMAAMAACAFLLRGFFV